MKRGFVQLGGALFILLVSMPFSPSGGVGAQQSAWNDPAVLGLIGRAHDVRQSATLDSTFQSYQAEARGYVYFFVDRPDSPEQMLVKADQVALDVFWQAPGSTKQRIVGLRDEKVLPTDIRYHLDHLTVVQDDFGDFIRLGDGDEVEQVLHPVGPASIETYDFQLADSLRISYAGGAEEVQVYEVRVRPKDFDRPGFVGSLYLDRDRAAIVRMNFSFTPASYVDPYLDYIRISLDNALWMGRHWLPYRQEVEIRREIPLFDFMAGSIIRGHFDIRGYDFNVDLPATLFLGTRVATVSPAQREAFPFERGIFDDLEEAGGLAPSPTMDEVHAQVRAVVEERALSGLAPVRLHVGQLSDFARYNRAEGFLLGGGATVRPRGDVLMRGTAGWSFGRSRASAAVTTTTEGSGVVPTVAAYWDALGDIGGFAGATRLENTISSVSGSQDFLDPYFRRGFTFGFAAPTQTRLSVSLTWEEHVGAQDVVSDGPDTDFRPVRSIDEGTMGALALTARASLPAEGQVDFTVTGGRLADRNFGSLTFDAAWTVSPDEEPWSIEGRASGGVTNPGAPTQTFYALGGRHTLPGHDYRLFVGNAFWLTRVEGTVPVWSPYLGIRAFAAVGSTYLGDADLPTDWGARDSRGLRGSVGLGLSIGWNSMRADVGRAVWGSGWEAVFSVAPQFRSWM